MNLYVYSGKKKPGFFLLGGHMVFAYYPSLRVAGWVGKVEELWVQGHSSEATEWEPHLKKQ